VINAVRDFLRQESAAGFMLVAAAILAMALANSPWHSAYETFLRTPFELRYGPWSLGKPTLLWINDGLMAVFFFLVGLELKREVLEGELSRPSQIALPGIAALGGMIVPAAIYALINRGDTVALDGWAIPTATDIAFALGVLSLLGARVPTAMKIFLMTLAVLDDLGAIIVIALFYTSQLSTTALAWASIALVTLIVMNRLRVVSTAAYILVGLVMWTSVLKSGVHATLAGVALALTIPMRDRATGESPLRELEHNLHAPVAWAILPLFAFANAGVSFEGIHPAAVIAPLPLGIAAGLLVGKPVGVFGLTWIAVRLGLAQLPTGLGWKALFGLSLLCGIGFTMSLFIGSLAFEQAGTDYSAYVRLGIITGSLTSALAGYFMLRATLSTRAAD